MERPLPPTCPWGWSCPTAPLPTRAFTQGRPEALGRELKVSRLLSWIKVDQVRNVVWFTADVHYTAAHHYDPSRAVFDDFARRRQANQPPSDGLQFFGHVAAVGRSDVMTVRLMDVAGEQLYSIELNPEETR